MISQSISYWFLWNLVQTKNVVTSRPKFHRGPAKSVKTCRYISLCCFSKPSSSRETGASLVISTLSLKHQCWDNLSFLWSSQSDFQSGVDKQKNQLTLDLIGQNLALSKAKSSTLPRLWKKGINKSSLIFPKNQFYLIENSKFLGTIDFGSPEQKLLTN